MGWLAIPTFGASEGVAQGVQAAKLVSVGKKVLTIVNAMRVSVATLSAPVTAVLTVVGVVIYKTVPLLKSVVKFRSVRKGKVITKTAKKPKRNRNKKRPPNWREQTPAERESGRKQIVEHGLRSKTNRKADKNKDHKTESLETKGGVTKENKNKIAEDVQNQIEDKLKNGESLKPNLNELELTRYDSKTGIGRFEEALIVKTISNDEIEVVVRGNVLKNGKISYSTVFIR